jgi:hypothetical protein
MRYIKTKIMNSKNLLLALLLAFATPVFAQDADMSAIPYRHGDLWGYANMNKDIIIKPEYEEADFFHEGFASVKKGGKYGYINREGKVVIPFKFYSAKPFRLGFFEKAANAKQAEGSQDNQKAVLFAGASLQANGYEICINTKGERMPKCPAISENSAPDINKSNTVTIVSNYSTIQKSDLFDKIIGDYKMPGAEDSYYIATRNNKYGVFNKTFDVIVPFEYDKIEKENIGVMVYLLAEKDGLKGMLFGNGSPYLAVENTKLLYVKAADGNNYFIFTKDGMTGLRNTKYQNVVEPLYTDITYDSTAGFILTGADPRKGYYFLNGNILKPEYAEIKAVKGGKFVMVKTQTGKWGYVSNNLVEFFEEE